MTKLAHFLFVPCLLLALAGCQRDQASAPPEDPFSPFADAPARQAEHGERVWVGLLPCSDCPGVNTRLVLRNTGGRRSYLMTETYLGNPGGGASFNRAGNWTEQTRLVDGEPSTFYILDPEQPGQRFALQSDGALALLDAEGRKLEPELAHRLQRL